jgi:RNA polymerase sigma-70 factor (ECF subfamily)
MPPDEIPTDELLRRAASDDDARQWLLAAYRERLCRMIAVRMDRRLAPRLDPSDVVQEALADAARKLPEYLRERPLPFYPWLRRLAWERLLVHNRRHLHAGKRSVTREAPQPDALPDESAFELARQLLAAGSTPSEHLLRAELRERVHAALTRLSAADREVLVLRHLEQLPVADVAGILGINVGAAKVRHLRALQRFRALLAEAMGEERP